MRLCKSGKNLLTVHQFRKFCQNVRPIREFYSFHLRTWIWVYCSVEKRQTQTFHGYGLPTSSMYISDPGIANLNILSDRLAKQPRQKSLNSADSSLASSQHNCCKRVAAVAMWRKFWSNN
jgi:hypothetical protein